MNIQRFSYCMKNRKESVVNLTPSPRLIKQIITRLLCVFSLLCIASCGVATTNTEGFSEKAQTHVQKGMTKNQVRSVLGNPVSVITMDGVERWSYTKVNPFNPFVQDQRNVMVSFNQTGKVTSVNTVGHRTSVGSVYGF